MGLLLLLYCALPDPTVLTETVDLIEVNHYHDENGKHNFSQLIFYTLDDDGAYRVKAWRLLKSDNHRPERAGDGWVVILSDCLELRRIRAIAIRESWTQYDPEVFERDIWPKEMRFGLLLERKSR